MVRDGVLVVRHYFAPARGVAVPAAPFGDVATTAVFRVFIFAVRSLSASRLLFWNGR